MVVENLAREGKGFYNKMHFSCNILQQITNNLMQAGSIPTASLLSSCSSAHELAFVFSFGFPGAHPECWGVSRKRIIGFTGPFHFFGMWR